MKALSLLCFIFLVLNISKESELSDAFIDSYMIIFQIYSQEYLVLLHLNVQMILKTKNHKYYHF